jgi:hypothetical protein
MRTKAAVLVGVFFLLAQGAFAQLRTSPAAELLAVESRISVATYLLSPLLLVQDRLPDNAAATPTSRRIPLVYRFEDLAFFCRVEVRLEQATRIPVRFRLGSVNYVDHLEGKRERY